ncbi:DUF1127 domain-containing protein [Frigidibacter albus]|uniref:DUF1127 domain-containing protein n=1 Tax=Frigidibacter albus TaxID=1465486 RepID=A0A6L8VIE2_9RHOB|nr:DUF1127 domain-containing protein [Frigidibacter albus]MZQ89884.1 DUF1127 domain-containing protein [Frigidibacter albus]NBE31741.1 DUF1127 domain-containing protein [Frigidibacter albus]GGH56167.1 hypothetical protein GCM10011341_24380 [Frigidibacter albus]
MSSLLLNASQSASNGVTLPRRAGILRQATRAISTYTTRRATRRALARLDSHLLRDVGLEPQHARQEVAKPFWLS